MGISMELLEEDVYKRQARIGCFYRALSGLFFRALTFYLLFGLYRDIVWIKRYTTKIIFSNYKESIDCKLCLYLIITAKQLQITKSIENFL